MGDTSNATWRFKWTGRVFTDTMLTSPTGCVNEEQRGLGVCLVWFSPSKKISHRDTDALPPFLYVLPRKQCPTPVPTLHQGLGRGRRHLPVRTGLYALQRGHILSFTSGAPALQTLSPHWTWLPSVDIGSTQSLDGACWASLLDFCRGSCSEGSGICAVTISLAWISVHHS